MAQAFSAYDYITQNNRKTGLLVLLFPLTLLLMVWLACFVAVLLVGDEDFIAWGASYLPAALGEVELTEVNAALGFTWAFAVPTFIVAIVWMTISYMFGDKMMMAFAGAAPMKKSDNPKLYRLVEDVAIMAGLPMPKIYLIDDESLNAFATGKNPKTASIAFTTGIVDKLKPLELQGVIAHEMSHIGNRDIRLNMLVITGVGVFGFLGEMLLRTRVHSSDSRSSKSNGQAAALIFFVGLALMLFNWIVAPLLQLALSRTREYAADATGAKIIHNPYALADALEKISKDCRVEALDQKNSMAVACIANPFDKISQLYSTHPPIKERIRRLRSM